MKFIPLPLFSSVEFDNKSNIVSAASIPDFIAVCVPFIFGTFKNPGLQPTKQPPGNESFGTDYSIQGKYKIRNRLNVPDNHLHLMHELHKQYVYHFRILIEFLDDF